jgi:ATP-dependent helicase/nuclease subunit B
VFEGKASAFDSYDHHVDVYRVQGHAAQAKVLNQILAEDYTDNELTSTAVILADESLLVPALQTIPTGANNKKIELNVTMGFPLATSTVFGMADLWLASQREMREKGLVSYANLQAFLTHPLAGLSQQMRDKIQSALIDENVVNVAANRLIRQGGIFEKFYRQVEKPQELIQQLLDVMHYLLLRLSASKSLKKIDAELFVKTIQELNRLNDTITAFIENEELDFVITLIQKALQGVSVPLSGDPLTGIQLMGLLESRNLNFDKIVFLGFNEGVIPKTSMGNSFIPDSIRRAYGLPVLENLDAISTYMVYRLLQRAKHISFVYNGLTDDSNSGEVSRILRQLNYESKFTFSEKTLNLEVKTELKERVEISKDHPRIKQILQNYLNKTKTISPSALTTYISNPADFFFRYIAEIKEPEEVSAVIEANEIGSILHKVMEYFYADSIGQQVSSELIKQKRKSVPTLIQSAYLAVMFEDEARAHEFSGMQKVILAIVDAYVNIILNRDEEHAPFTIISLEQKINAEVAFELNGKAESVKIFGYIDRIDEKDGTTRIIDYKTGSDKLTFSDIDKVFDTDGKHINKALIQTLLYTYAFEQQSGKDKVEPNLYIVKTMAEKGEVWFKSQRKNLKDEFLDEIKPRFLAGLQTKLAELFSDEPFRVSEVDDNYRYSIYKTMFGR